MQICVIPVKEFKNAKERLSGLLSPEERARLALAMYEDVLDVVMQATHCARVLIVSTDRLALEIAERQGAMIYREADQRGQSASVELAATIAQRMGGTAVLALPIDVPLIAVEDIVALWSRFHQLQRAHDAGSPLAVMTPSHDALGTNALLRCPPDSLPCRFGHDSLQRHLREATAQGVAYDLYESFRLALDIDTPRDLMAFLHYASPDGDLAPRTCRELLAMHILERVS